MRNVIVFVMAGGKGERLWPLTKDRAKPAVPFGGIYRIIDFTLSNCVNSGLRRIHVLIQYKSHSLMRHLRMGWNIFDPELGEYIDIIPAQQRTTEHWYLGTADAIHQNLYIVEGEQPDCVLVLAGDHIYKMNYARMLDYHKEKQADCTIGVVEFPKTHSKELGVVEVASDGRVIGFQEKPAAPKTVPGRHDVIYASMGIYVFNRETIKEETTLDAERRDSTHDFGRDVIAAMLSRKRKVYAYNFIDENKQQARYWRDIGTIDAYYEANMDLIQVTPVFNLYDQGWPIRTHQEQFPPAKFVFAQEGKDERIGLALDSLISDGCIISGGRVERSIVGHNVRVHSYSLVQDAILMEGVDVGRHAKIRRAIIDKDIQLPPQTEIGYDLEADRKRFFVTPSGLTVVAKGTLLA